MLSEDGTQYLDTACTICTHKWSCTQVENSYRRENSDTSSARSSLCTGCDRWNQTEGVCMHVHVCASVCKVCACACAHVCLCVQIEFYDSLHSKQRYTIVMRMVQNLMTAHWQEYHGMPWNAQDWELHDTPKDFPKQGTHLRCCSMLCLCLCSRLFVFLV